MDRSTFLPALCLLHACVFAASHPGAALLVDRGLPSQSNASSAGASRIGWPTAGVYIADRFALGQPGELWVIDKVRVWSVPGLEAGRPGALGDLFEKITLFGGIESETKPATPQQAALVCACHGPVAIAATAFSRGSSASQDSHVVLTPVSSAGGPSFDDSGRSFTVWQVDFDDLRWNVPGGVNLQFGVYGEGLPQSADNGKHIWFNLASQIGGDHEFRLFETGGSPVVPPAGALPQNKSLGINVQVWGHRTARIDIRRSGNAWQVKLESSPGIDILQVKPESLHFGPKGAAPVESTVEPSARDGGADLVLKIGSAGTGIQPNQPVACLDGVTLDNVPFEGCGAITWR